MDFCAQTYVLCGAFLASSLNESQREVQSMIESETSISTKLHLITEGELIVKSLLSLVDDFDCRFKRSYELEPVVENLDIDDEAPTDVAALEKSYLEVLDGLFEKHNWGRIVAMFAFLRMLVLRLAKNGHNYTILTLINITSKYCDAKLRQWIELRNGWSGLIEFDNVHLINDDSSVIWGTLRNVGGFATGAVGALGIAALVGYIAHKI